MSLALSHFAIVRQALADERARVGRAVAVDEKAFLPAALELVERPVSPTLRLTTWLLLAGLICTILWLSLGRVDIVSIAQGKVVPSGNVKLVQPAEPGIVRRILVQEGQTVRRGQPLVLLDPTDADAEAGQARAALATARLDAARARAVIGALDGGALVFAAPDGTRADVAAVQAALARAQYSRIVADGAMRAGESRAAAAAINEARIQAVKLTETLPLLDEQIAANEALLERGYVSKLKVIDMRRQRMAAARDRDASLATIARATAQRSAASGGAALSRAEARAMVLTELIRAEAAAAQHREALTKATRRAELRTLAAPVDGIVTGLALHTEGGMVQSTQPIMTIVPLEGGVMVEARILSRDTGFIRAGQPADVKLDAFPFNRHGTVPGRVQWISADAQDDERLGQVFTARVLLDRATIDRGDRIVPLTPGMSATVDIKTGRRSLMSYLWSPVESARLEAARER